MEYDFRFNRKEAEVMLEILKARENLFSKDLSELFDRNYRCETDMILDITRKLIKKIERQINTKKKVLNFKLVDYTRLHLASSLKLNRYEKDFSYSSEISEIEDLKEKIQICETLVKRIWDLSYIGEPPIITQMRREFQGNFNSN